MESYSYNNQQHMRLVIRLKQKLINDVLHSKTTYKNKKHLHKKVAERYVQVLESYESLDDTSALNHIFNDIRQRHGVLGASKEIRGILAEELCQHIGIKMQHLYEEIRKIVNNPDQHLGLEDAKIIVALDMIESYHIRNVQKKQKKNDLTY